jgi:RNase P/RNase MRP subunit p29
MTFRILLPALSVVLLLPLNLFAKCPISPNGTLELRAPAGNLKVKTSGTDSVEVQVSNRQVVVQETCGRDVVTVNAKGPSNIGIPDWSILVPSGITLDLSTQGGNIQVEDTDGRETLLRTSGGKVTAGHIKGNALIMATEVRTGNIDGNAELRGLGGRLHVGDVGGNALFVTPGGDITTGRVRGQVKAESGSGSITIRESNGDVIVTTKEGDITSDYVHGSFDGKTESGNIRLEKVGSSVRALTGVGDIFFLLVPEKPNADVRIKAEASRLGNITMFLPSKMKATVVAIVEKPALGIKGIFSDFPLNPVGAIRSLVPGGPERQRAVINGGGANVFDVHTSAGKIEIRDLDGN